MDQEKWRTSIRPAFKRKLLLRGTLFASLGIALLLYGISLSVSQLSLWGIPLFLGAGGLLVFGMIPYKKLCRLETTPYELSFHADGNISLHQKDKRLMNIPIKSLQKIGYIDRRGHCGIGLWLKKPRPEKLGVYTPAAETLFSRSSTSTLVGEELFLPYFSERAFKAMTELLIASDF